MKLKALTMAGGELKETGRFVILTTGCNIDVTVLGGELKETGRFVTLGAGTLVCGNKLEIIAAKNEEPCCTISLCVVISSVN